MNRFEAIMDLLEKLVVSIGKIMSFLIFIVMAIIVFELILRWLFNSPTEWVHEASTILYGSFFILGGGYALVKGDHVKMDVFYARFKTKNRAILDIITFPIFIIYMVILVWFGSKIALYSIKIQEHTQTVWGPPIYPSKTILVIGAMLVLIAGCIKFIRDLMLLYKRKESI